MATRGAKLDQAEVTAGMEHQSAARHRLAAAAEASDRP